MASYTFDGTPTAIRHDFQGNLWVITQPGKVYKNGALFLDLINKLVKFHPVYDERGLLSIALHPTLANRYYLMYTAPGTVGLNILDGPQATDTQWNEEKYTTLLVLEEYEGQQPRRKLLELKHPGFNHNTKDSLSFRPSDGALLWALGDDGFEYDLLNLAQRDQFIKGKLLAVNLAQVPDSRGPLSRVAQLPVGVTVEGKGLRNPVSLQHALCGTRELTFVTCPGQERFEWAFAFEGKGHNFGWRTYEGPERTRLPLNLPVHSNDPDFPHYQPFMSYSHKQINSLKGSVTTGGRLVGTVFYFLDYQNGLYQCTPNLDNLQQAVPFQKVKLPLRLDSYTSLGQEGQVLLIAGLLRGRGYLYTLEV
jgi:hypothetical protein